MAGRKMPIQKPGKSEQSVGTPKAFIRSVCDFLDIEKFVIDLAAEKHNKVSEHYFNKQMDSLTQSWHQWAPGQLNRWAWLNPPYSDIAPWVRKALEEREIGASVAVLVPASVGSNWWRDYVHGEAHVLFLNGRITFDGHKQGYPKDLALLLYDDTHTPGYHIWNWRT